MNNMILIMITLNWLVLKIAMLKTTAGRYN